MIAHQIKQTETLELRPVARMTEPCPTPGVYTDISAEDYHKIDALNASTLGKFAISGLHGAHYLEQEQEKPTAAMLFGTALHSAILEPEDFEARKLVCEDIGPASEANHWKKQDENPDAIILRKGWHEQIQATQLRIQQHRTAKHLLEQCSGNSELTLIWHMEREIDGQTIVIPCKARVDRYTSAFTPIEGMGEVSSLIDVKTTKSVDPNEFERSIANFGYHRQAAWYLVGAKECGLVDSFHDYSYIVVACEKSAPYPVATYPIVAAALHQGLAECGPALNAYIKYRTLGHAPGPSDSLVPLSIPNWAMKPDNEI